MSNKLGFIFWALLFLALAFCSFLCVIQKVGYWTTISNAFAAGVVFDTAINEFKKI